MFKVLLMTWMLPFSVFAAEEIKTKDSDVFFKIGGGARLRQYYIQDAAAGGLDGEDYNRTSHRLQVDLRLDKGEYFQTFVRVINSSTWGQNEDTDNNFIIQQGWGNWKVSDFLNLRFGRVPIQIGRGLVYGFNDWENLPTYYDGFSGLFSWNVLDISIHALRIYELNRSNTMNTVSDPEITNYILDLSFKDLSDSITMADFSFVQTIGDLGVLPKSGGLITPKQRLQRYGFDFETTSINFETAGSVSYVTGDVADMTSKTTASQYMLDGEARFVMPEWSRFNLWVGGHYDSGDDNPNDSDDNQYVPLNYNLHQNAGRMDFFKFGNLTFYRAGTSLHFLSDWYVGAEYFMFMKTTAKGANYLERSVLQAQLANNTIRFGDNKDLGQEIDVWVGKTFQSGVTLELTFNYLAPGAAMDTAYIVSSNTVTPLDNTIYNVILDVGMFF